VLPRPALMVLNSYERTKSQLALLDLDALFLAVRLLAASAAAVGHLLGASVLVKKKIQKLKSLVGRWESDTYRHGMACLTNGYCLSTYKKG
jgi:hypothetical protein